MQEVLLSTILTQAVLVVAEPASLSELSVKNRIAIFASGAGSNAERLMAYFANHPTIMVGLVLSNNSSAYVLERTKKFQISTHVFNRTDFYQTDQIVDLLKHHQIDLVVLAGFLWLVPENLISAFPNKIINIHPALLPKYGGKGMYGDYVHKQVLACGETESGITIHFVNSQFDEGKIIHQVECKIDAKETLDSLKVKIQQLEHENYPVVIDKLLSASL